MHSFGYRANALLTLALTIMAIMCAMASFSDTFNSPSPSAHIQVLNIRRFQRLSTGNDEVTLSLNITADLQSLFTWNTKQVFVFVAAEYETHHNVLNQVGFGFSTERKILWKCAIFAIIWMIWIETKERIFKGRSRDVSLLWDKVLFLVLVWSKATGVFHDVATSSLMRNDWQIILDG